MGMSNVVKSEDNHMKRHRNRPLFTVLSAVQAGRGEPFGEDQLLVLQRTGLIALAGDRWRLTEAGRHTLSFL
ncbi:hypothetical protein DOI34_24640 [Salmonella enterica subsp. enterica serovar Virchow]|nr:hypothetical protein [Salmonella enterica subsp. enterica serovar Virchow]